MERDAVKTDIIRYYLLPSFIHDDMQNVWYSVSPINKLIGLVGRVFANGPVDLSSIPGHVIPKTLRMVLDTTLLNTQLYKVRIKGKVEQSRERSSALHYTSVK